MKSIGMKDMGSEMLAWQFHTSHYFVVHAALFLDLHLSFYFLYLFLFFFFLLLFR